jgi:hypothetical protein
MGMKSVCAEVIVRTAGDDDEMFDSNFHLESMILMKMLRMTTMKMSQMMKKMATMLYTTSNDGFLSSASNVNHFQHVKM